MSQNFQENNNFERKKSDLYFLLVKNIIKVWQYYDIRQNIYEKPLIIFAKSFTINFLYGLKYASGSTGNNIVIYFSIPFLRM